METKAIIYKDGNNIGETDLKLVSTNFFEGNLPLNNSWVPNTSFGFQFNMPIFDGLRNITKINTVKYNRMKTLNDLGLVKKLSSLPIDLNSKNKDGLTALHKAAMIAKDDVMLKYLLSIGVIKDITTEFDETAYSLAKENETLTTNKIDLEFLK